MCAICTYKRPIDTDTANPRRQRGMLIAATMKVVKLQSGAWRVPSQTLARNYAVLITAAGSACSCPDFEERQLPCKHIFAVQFTLFQETTETPDGETVTTTTATARVTYRQNWPAYNAAQTTEKDQFCRLLRDLCANVQGPPQTRGRPRLPLGDMLFASAFKVYSTVSARRFMSDLRAAQASGFISRTPHYNSIFNYLESEAVTPVIVDLITASSLPLRAVETDFAIDSTGIGMSNFFRYYSYKYEDGSDHHDWLKLHAMVGVKTNVVTSVDVTQRYTGDSPYFKPLVEETARNFTIREVSADKAYLSHRNLELIDDMGAAPYIPFKSNSTADNRYQPPVWKKLYHLFAMHRDEFLAHYHKRSNVESTFSAIKRVFGGSVRSRTFTAQVNEAFLKVLCHNIRCVIHAMHELGITPTFGCPTNGPAAQEVVAL